MIAFATLLFVLFLLFFMCVCLSLNRLSLSLFFNYFHAFFLFLFLSLTPKGPRISLFFYALRVVKSPRWGPISSWIPFYCHNFKPLLSLVFAKTLTFSYLCNSLCYTYIYTYTYISFIVLTCASFLIMGSSIWVFKIESFCFFSLSWKIYLFQVQKRLPVDGNVIERLDFYSTAVI